MTSIEVQPNATGHAPRDLARTRHGASSQGHSPERVAAVLRELPSHGWTAGWIGRRDRALLTLSELAGLSFGKIAALTAGDMSVVDGVATIRTQGGRTTLQSVDDDLQCGPCALARWVHALDLTVVYPDGRVIAAVIGRAMPLTADSPHLCRSNNAITEVTARVALLPSVDHWGHPYRVVSMLRPVPVSRPRDGRRYNVPAAPDTHRVMMREDVADRANVLEGRVEQLLNAGGPL